MGVWKINKKDSQILKQTFDKAFMNNGFSMMAIGKVIQNGIEKYKTYNAKKKYITEVLAKPKNTDAPNRENGEVK